MSLAIRRTAFTHSRVDCSSFGVRNRIIREKMNVTVFVPMFWPCVCMSLCGGSCNIMWLNGSTAQWFGGLPQRLNGLLSVTALVCVCVCVCVCVHASNDVYSVAIVYSQPVPVHGHYLESRVHIGCIGGVFEGNLSNRNKVVVNNTRYGHQPSFQGMSCNNTLQNTTTYHVFCVCVCWRLRLRVAVSSFRAVDVRFHFGVHTHLPGFRIRLETPVW